MKKIKLLLLIAFTYIDAAAQNNWVTIYSTRGGFSFSFPQNTPAYDTLGLLVYADTLPGDNTISLQVNYISSVSISGNNELRKYLSSHFVMNSPSRILPPDDGGGGGGGGDPCFVDSIEAVLSTYAQMFQSATEGTIEGFVTNDYSPCYIRGKELTIRHPELSGNPGFYFAFTRYFYWNGKFLAFTVTGPEEKLYELNAYKNQLFSSIVIY